MRKFFVYSLLMAFVACQTKTQVDTIVHNAVIYTVDSAFTITEAMAVKDGKIVATGKNDDILNRFGAKETINAQGKPVYPGFIDAHAHFLGYGKGLFEVKLYNCDSWEDVIHHITDGTKGVVAGEWIIGRGWDQNKFLGKQYPTNDKLNQLFPNNPVFLTRVDGHAAIANQKALDMAGVKAGTTLTGGEIEIKNGKLSGILIDNATTLIENILPKPTKANYEKWLLAAQNNCFAQGLTTVTDCGLMYDDVEKIDALQKEGKLNIRLFVMLSDASENYNHYLQKGPYKTDKLFVNGFKVYADGALGSRGACLLHPYSDKPNWTGFLLNSKAHYDSVAALLVNTKFQMCTHAIGDSANREILTIYNKYLKGKNDKRWRIEHAQVVNEADFNLFGSANVVPSVQPTHATSDMYWATERLGNERIKGAYAYKQLLQQNGWLALGTDFPVEDISPFKTFLAAVFRQDNKQYPNDGFQISNGLTKEETLKGMTIWAAKAGFLEQEIGSLEVGKKADFIMLDNDIMSANATNILTIKPLLTVLGGRKVFGK